MNNPDIPHPVQEHEVVWVPGTVIHLYTPVIAEVEIDGGEGGTHTIAVETARLHRETTDEVLRLKAEVERVKLSELKERGRAVSLEMELAAARAEVEAERIENAHLREAFVVMERAANAHEAEVARLKEALENIKRSAMGMWVGELAKAALELEATP